MYCLNAFKSFIQRKATAKILVCDHARLSVPTKTTLISRSALDCSALHIIGKMRTDNLPDVKMSIKGPLTYAGFPITHIETASVFCSPHM